MSDKKIVIMRNYPTCPCGTRLRARQKKYCGYTCKNKYSVRKPRKENPLDKNWINFGKDEK